jgi:2-polyprenyl-3-methyl-5-hydroxy-6-metoxy-1,4-benzoquinol methylase
VKSKILTFNWHESYIHLLARTGYYFDVVEKWKGGRFGWIEKFRPIPSNCRLISEDEAKAGLNAGAYARIIAHNINDLFSVNEWPIPKILIFHNKLSTEIALGGNTVDREAYLENARQLIDSTKDLSLVFISKAKMEDWGMKGEVILPGVDTADYGGWRGDIHKVLRVGNFLMERDIMLGYSVQGRLLKGLPSTVLGLNPNITDSYVPKSWEEFKNFMRGHRVYLNTTIHSFEDGYNLAMLEAMATGMPVVSIANPSSPIKNGINGYVSPDENYLRGKIVELLGRGALVESLGRKAIETVMDKFPIERFVRDWRRVIGESVCAPACNIKIEDDKSDSASDNNGERLRILMSYTSNPQTTASYIEKALRENHDVITYGPAIDDRIIKYWDLEQIRDRVKEHDIPYFTPDLEKVVRKLPSGWIPDLFLWIESGVSYSLFGTKKLSCPSVCYLIDTHLNFEKHLEIAKDYDFVFLAQKEYLPRFKEAGFQLVYWLPLGCDPGIHKKRNVEKFYDIGFVGNLNQQKRIDLLDVLKERFNFYHERCFLERMVEVYSQSRIVFNNSANNDLNMRVFEVLCSGSLLLTDDARGSGLTGLFQDRKHLVIYHNKNELIKLAEYYLKNHDERERIAAVGGEEVLRKHTYGQRVKQMIGIIKPLLDEKIIRDDKKIWDNHPEALVLQPYCVGKGIDVGSGFRKTHPDAIGIDIIPKGKIGEHGCMQGMRSVADITTSGDNLYMFEDGELDYVINRHNLEHYVDVVRTLLEWKRVLKVGGILGMVLPDESKINTIALDPTHKHCFTPESIKGILELIGGFAIERLERVIENWSFLIVARKIEEEGKNMEKTILSGNIGEKRKTVKPAKPAEDVATNGYFCQERRDVETLIPNGTNKILDVGCGEGILGRRLLEKGASEVVGIEFFPDACERAEKNMTGVICGDIEKIDLPFDEGYFDCLIVADILEHLKDPLSTLKKLRKHLSDSGVVVASIPNVRYHGIINMLVEGHWKYEDHGILDKTHLRFFTRKEIERLFTEAGFEITGITANIDPAYNSLKYPLSGEISFGRVSLVGLTPEELKDLFVFQYLLKAQKTGVEVQRLNDAVKTSVEEDDPDRAKKVFEEYLALHPADTDVLFRYAEMCWKLGLVDKAGESLERILIFEPDREDALELRRIVEKACKE